MFAIESEFFLSIYFKQFNSLICNDRTLHFLNMTTNSSMLKDRNFYDDMKSYYAFKEGYQPTYSDSEKQAIQRRREKRAAAVENTTPRGKTPPPPPPEQDTPAAFRPSPGEASEYWILDRRIADGAKGLGFYVRIWEGPWANTDKDQVVHYSESNGLLELRITPDLKKQTQAFSVDPAHICCMGKFRSDKVASLPNNAQGLYLVVEGDHIGKLGRRVNHIREPEGNQQFVLKHIEVEKSKQRYTQTLSLDIPFVVHRDHLLEISESSAMRKTGNELVTNLRRELGGNWKTGGNRQPRG
jgi:hypothetical protein